MLVLVGHGPVVETLATLGVPRIFLVVALAPTRCPPGSSSSRYAASVSVVATPRIRRGRPGSSAQDRCGLREPGASRRRAGVILERSSTRACHRSGAAGSRRSAGLDIGAVTPEENRRSILAEIIQHRPHRQDSRR